MRVRSRLVCSSLVITAAATANLLVGEDPTNGTAIALFNGRDLSGWHSNIPYRQDHPDAEASFVIRDSNLVSLGEPRGHLIMGGTHSNYRVDVKYRFTGEPGSCGVLVHASIPWPRTRISSPTQSVPERCEFQIACRNRTRLGGPSELKQIEFQLRSYESVV